MDNTGVCAIKEVAQWWNVLKRIQLANGCSNFIQSEVAHPGLLGVGMVEER